MDLALSDNNWASDHQIREDHYVRHPSYMLSYVSVSPQYPT